MRNKNKTVSALFLRMSFLPKTLFLIWQASGLLMVVWLIVLILQGLLPIALLSVTKQVIDLLPELARKRAFINTQNVFHFIYPIISLVLILLTDQLLRGTDQLVRAVQSDKIQNYITNLIQEKALSLDISFYDSPSFYDRMHQVKNDALSRPIALLEGIGTIGQHSITLAGISILLSAYAFWIPVILIIGIIPALWYTITYAGMVNQWRLRNTIEERRCQYIDMLLTMKDAAQELRLYGLGGYYRNIYQKKRKILIKEKVVLEKKNSLSILLQSSLTC